MSLSCFYAFKDFLLFLFQRYFVSTLQSWLNNCCILCHDAPRVVVPLDYPGRGGPLSVTSRNLGASTVVCKSKFDSHRSDGATDLDRTLGLGNSKLGLAAWLLLWTWLFGFYYPRPRHGCGIRARASALLFVRVLRWDCYIYIYIYICTCIYVYVFVCMYIYIYMYMYMCMYVCVLYIFTLDKCTHLSRISVG